jgi:asparagine synthase (glutamine-hydrolysing)
MCGICGFVSKNKVNIEDLIKMNNTLIHRGPDDHGEEIYQLKDLSCLGLAQRRLSIIDLSENGHQPMHSDNKRISVIFNGEIFNFSELKKELCDYNYKSNSDTEVIIAAYIKWGISFVDRIKGMFAIVIYDRDNEDVYLIRDRIGVKPLYYYSDGKSNIVFASELKAILEYPYFNKQIDSSVIGSFLQRQYIAAPFTIYKNTRKVQPGGYIRIHNGNIEEKQYWNIADANRNEKNSQIDNYADAEEELEKLLEKSISERLVADVSVGAFLSGGYDSSLICAMAQKISNKRIKTFSIGFGDKEFNEAEYAKKVANHIGTDHTEFYVTEEDMLSVLNDIPIVYDEPFADSSQIPTMLVSKLAKENVAVALTGDGGDELFGGYNIYRYLQTAQKKALLGKIRFYYDRILCTNSAKKNKSFIDRLVSDDINAEARTQIGINSYIDAIRQIMVNPSDCFHYYEIESKYGEKRYAMIRMLLDLETSLPDDMLVKVDRASMHYSLECRCPLLDRDIVDFSFRLPEKFKVVGTMQKRILKDLTYKYIPQTLMERPKMGFSIPLDKWMRTTLKDQLIDFTDVSFLRNQGIFNPAAVKKFVISYLSNGDGGKLSGSNFSRICWSYFVFQQWYMNMKW